jgi:hypothetical protein
MMTRSNMVDAVRVLRDEVLDTVEHGDRDPPGAEVFDALLRTLASEGNTASGYEVLGEDIARRLAWGDTEERVLADAERVFDRVVTAIERAVRDPVGRMVVLDAVALIASTVARVVSLSTVARASRDRAAKLREEMTQRQLEEVLHKQKQTILRLEQDLKHDF